MYPVSALVAYEKLQRMDDPENQYIRRLVDSEGTRLMVSMFPEQSRRLQEASELMVDTSFKRLCGDWKEFTIDGYDSRLQTSTSTQDARYIFPACKNVGILQIKHN